MEKCFMFIYHLSHIVHWFMQTKYLNLSQILKIIYVIGFVKDKSVCHIPWNDRPTFLLLTG
jgi:hypothetical protein